MFELYFTHNLVLQCRHIEIQQRYSFLDAFQGQIWVKTCKASASEFMPPGKIMVVYSIGPVIT